MPDPRWKEEWPEFSEAVQKKLQAGFEEHSDWSFARTPEDLADEVIEEMLDICGWTLILYVRMKNLKRHIEEIRQESASLEKARDMR